MGTVLDDVPFWGLIVIVITVLIASMEVGYRAGRWRHRVIRDEKEQPVGAMVTSILGLLALVLGFTFNLAASRFDARRQVVLEEANAIGTCYLRARLLPEPERSQITRQLREYVDIRLLAVQQNATQEAISESEEMHERLWDETSKVAERQPQSILVGVFIQSLNNVIDLHAKRVLVGIRSRIPLVMWASLLTLVVTGMTAVGYQAGLAATRRSPAMIGLVFAFTIVLSLIIDLDRGGQGFLRVSQQSMIDLQHSIAASEGEDGG
ncbi:MAG: hypothetical protein U0939_20365 [Pirellulales bacterium]